MRVFPLLGLVLCLAPATRAQTKAETVQQTVTVTADRGLAGIDDQATSVVLLTHDQLAAAPGACAG